MQSILSWPSSGLLAGFTFLTIHSIHAAETVAPVVVTATRTAQTADESLAAVTVIERQDIELSQAKSVTDLLRNLAGVMTTQDGGIGKNESVFIRGTNSNHVLVLVDGVRASSATLGTYAWHTLRPEQIERIEVVRGPRASLYGSDAIGGVIQIFTRKNSTTSIAASTGSHNTDEYQIATGGGENTYYSLQAGKTTSDGIPTNEIFTDNHGNENKHFQLQAGTKYNDTSSINASFMQNNGRSFLDPDTGDFSFRNQVGNIKINSNFSDTWQQSLQMGYALDESTSYSPYTPGTITTRRHNINWQNNLQIGQNLTTIGLDLVNDHVTKDNSGLINQTLLNKAIYLQQQLYTGNSELLISGRLDDTASFGNHGTWNLAWGTKSTSDSRYYLSAGSAFKAPTVNDLYWPYSTDVFGGDTYITLGNAALKPETSKSLEAGLRRKIGNNNRLETSIYYTTLENLIQWLSTQTGPNEYTYQPQNINNATIRGAEISLSSKLDSWTLSESISITHATDNATGLQLDRRPREQVKLQSVYQQNVLQWLTEILYTSARLDQSGAVELGGYTLCNTSLTHAIDKNTSLSLRVENLFDKKYVTSTSFNGNYNTYGTSAYLGIRYALQ